MKRRRPVAVLAAWWGQRRGPDFAAAVLTVVALVGSGGRSSAQEEPIQNLVETAKNPGRLSDRLRAVDRIGAVSDLRIIQEWKLVDVLLDLANDANPRLARVAISKLGGWTRGVARSIISQIVGPLAQIMANKERHTLVRREAIRQLGQTLKDELTYQDAIVKMISVAGNRSDEPEVRREAYQALGDIGSPKARNVIRLGLSDKDDTVSQGAFEALDRCLRGANGDEFAKDGARIMGTLVQKLRSPNTSMDTKVAVYGIMGWLIRRGYKSSTVEKQLIQVLEDEDNANLVVAVLEVVSYMGSGNVAKGVESAYTRFTGRDDRDPRAAEIRREACATAGGLFDYWSQEKRSRKLPLPVRPAGVLMDLLCKALKEDPQSDVKGEAAVALGNLYDKGYDKRKAAVTLIVVLGHEAMGEEIKAAALESLEVLTGRNFAYDTDRWEKWYKENQSKLAPKTR